MPTMRSLQFTRIKAVAFLSLTLVIQHARAQDTTRLSILVVGDIMQHDSQIQSAYRSTIKAYDYRYCFQHVASLVEKADLAIGNLEVTLAGTPYKGYPQFSAPDELAVALKNIGFDVLVTANNHSLDRGKKGLERTIRTLDSLGLKHTGTFEDSAARANTYPLKVNAQGISLALLNYTYGTNGIPVPKGSVVNLIDTVQIKQDISRAKAMNPDAIMVFFHWGWEYQSQPNKEQRLLTKMCWREGVQLVMGAHPHVLQPMEWHRDQNQLVVYSLGNFVSGQRTRYRDGGAILNLELEKIVNDSTSTTSIRDVSYDLVWVSTQKPGGYTVLPVKEFEADTLWSGPQSKQMLRTFVSDSRKLFGKYNINVPERARPAIDSACYQIVAFDTTEWQHPSILEFYHARKNKSSMGHSWTLGKFFDLEVAMSALRDIQTRLQPKVVQLWKFEWGMRSEEVVTGQ